ncbi:hypothetical protein RZS28_05035 [Methylocapsa polymorpha]|uniref:Uncharacterized protein n=1 Tax=Methylocapsa polymorpha TaxID=3080828 RepID=A0ABZ0HVR7_9HYPH|nr:hypothetical protein RZS28_05035 [Methylocapsa sp. RX1]
MSVGKIFAVLAFLSLFAVSAASAGKISNDAAGAKEDNVPSPPAVQDVRRDFPIVMGRSVSVHHKTKLHHIKMKPTDLIEKSAAPEEAE